MTNNDQPLTTDDEEEAEEIEEDVLVIPEDAYTGDVIGGVRLRRAITFANGLFMALFGKGGAGKTTLAAETYKIGKTLLIDAEAGSDVLDDLANEPNLVIADVNGWVEFESVVTSLRQKGVGDYKAIIVDNYSELQDMCETKFDIKGGDRNDLMKYNLVTKAMRRSMKDLRAIARKHKIIVILIFWDWDEKDKDGTFIRKDLMLTPKLRATFPGLCTMIGHVRSTNNNDVRVLDFASNTRTVSKFKRSRKSAAQKVPYEITYKLDNLPLVDIINTIFGRSEWDKDKYKKPPLTRTEPD